ncbi:hypothetical protein GCM10022403_019330 [Streptomyces coacervatus]|uniref:Transposase n=1 Tax=Streptomyces coacervatus TaxID=647381 RepID=A0ABP7H4Z3_9ACTN
MLGVVKGYSVRRPSFNAYDNADPWVCLGYRREVSSRVARADVSGLWHRFGERSRRAIVAFDFVGALWVETAYAASLSGTW